MRDWENNIRRVVPYTPGEQPKNTCVIKLNTNENPYPPAPGVKEVLSNFNTDDLRLYPDPRVDKLVNAIADFYKICLLYTSPSPRDGATSRMPSSA